MSQLRTQVVTDAQRLPTGSWRWPAEGHCGARAFNRHIKAVWLPVERLPAWEGVPGKGDSIIEESLQPA